MYGDNSPKVTRVTSMMDDFYRKRDESLNQLREEFGQQKIQALLDAGFTDDQIIGHLSENSHRHGPVINAVENFLRAKALLEFHNVEDADHVAATLVAPMTSPAFPKELSIMDRVAVHVEGSVEAQVEGRVSTN